MHSNENNGSTNTPMQHSKKHGRQATSPAQETGAGAKNDRREWDEAPEDFEPDDDGINYSGLDPAFPDWGSVNSMFV